MAHLHRIVQIDADDAVASEGAVIGSHLGDGLGVAIHARCRSGIGHISNTGDAGVIADCQSSVSTAAAVAQLQTLDLIHLAIGHGGVSGAITDAAGTHHQIGIDAAQHSIASFQQSVIADG